MISPGLVRCQVVVERRTAHLRRPDNQSRIEQPTRFEIRQQSRDGLIDFLAMDRKPLLNGAVIVPATTLLTRNDLSDRFARGQVRHVIANAEAAAKFADLPGDYTRIVVGQELEGWTSFEKGYAASTRFTPEGETRANDPLLLYFTSGTTAAPKGVVHTHASTLHAAHNVADRLGLTPDDRTWGYLPFFFTGGLVAVALATL